MPHNIFHAINTSLYYLKVGRGSLVRARSLDAALIFGALPVKLGHIFLQYTEGRTERSISYCLNHHTNNWNHVQQAHCSGSGGRRGKWASIRIETRRFKYIFCPYIKLSPQQSRPEDFSSHWKAITDYISSAGVYIHLV